MDDGVRESNAQWIDCSLKLCASFPGAEVQKLDGLLAAWCDTALPMLNMVFLSRPVTDWADLVGRAEALAEYLKTKHKPALFAVCHEWVPEYLYGDVNTILAGAGLLPAMTITGMAAGELPPPRRALPDLEYRPVKDQETRDHVADINSAAYGFSAEWGREALALPEIWTDELCGHVAYLDGKAVATSTAMVVNDRLHVICVATIPEAQRRGYAEAVMRRSLAEAAQATGLQRTTLHATEAGHPGYGRMGYQDTAKFTAYTSWKPGT